MSSKRTYFINMITRCSKCSAEEIKSVRLLSLIQGVHQYCVWKIPKCTNPSLHTWIASHTHHQLININFPMEVRTRPKQTYNLCLKITFIPTKVKFFGIFFFLTNALSNILKLQFFASTCSFPPRSTFPQRN